MIEQVEQLIVEVNDVIKEMGWSDSTENYIRAVKIVRDRRRALIVLMDDQKYLNEGYYKIQ